MVLEIQPYEQYILHRVEREGRMGKLEAVSDTLYKFSIDLYDAMEMLPWIRTFIGRIVKLECGNPLVTATFYKDFNLMLNMNGVDTSAVQ